MDSRHRDPATYSLLETGPDAELRLSLVCPDGSRLSLTTPHRNPAGPAPAAPVGGLALAALSGPRAPSSSVGPAKAAGGASPQCLGPARGSSLMGHSLTLPWMEKNPHGPRLSRSAPKIIFAKEKIHVAC